MFDICVKLRRQTACARCFGCAEHITPSLWGMLLAQNTASFNRFAIASCGRSWSVPQSMSSCGYVYMQLASSLHIGVGCEAYLFIRHQVDRQQESLQRKTLKLPYVQGCTLHVSM